MKVETDVNVTSGGSDDVTRDAIEACAARLNASLQQVELLDRILAELMSAGDDDGDGGVTRRPLTVIGATSDCLEARMTPAGFLYLTSGWQCPQHLVLDRQRWRCATRSYHLLFFSFSPLSSVDGSDCSDYSSSLLLRFNNCFPSEPGLACSRAGTGCLSH